MFINHLPFLIIISSPSGAGKSTLCKMIINNDPLIRLSISATTRAKRPQEIDGQHYFFVSHEEFILMQQKQEFLESAKVFDNLYGTPKKMVDDSLKNGHCVLFDIDWQGARQIRSFYPAQQIVSIFILPPSLPELERRLRARAQDPEKVVLDRMKKACDEIEHFHEYDYFVINDDLNKSYQNIRSIIEAKRIARQDPRDINRFINQFNIRK